MSFVHVSLAGRVIFGSGSTARLGEELDRLDLSRVLILTTAEQADLGARLGRSLGASCAGLFTGAAMHTPVDVTERALQVFQQTEAQGVVSIGGGSTTGLGKAIALRTACPQIAIPTTYAGSEMTPLLGQTEDGRKTTIRDLRVLPETVIYDPDHTLSLPLGMSVTSAMNAMAHAVEALYVPDSSPLLCMSAEAGIQRISEALPHLVQDPSDPAAREQALMGAWLCASCLGTGGIALHHRLCHVLGGAFELPHAEIHTALLPHALAYNSPAIPTTMETLRRATGSSDPAGKLFDLPAEAGATMALRDLGMGEEMIDRAVAITLEAPYPNPRPLHAEALRATLRSAWAGDRPHA